MASRTYLANADAFPEFAIVACADEDPSRAEALGSAYGIPACPVDELASRADVALVLNLTPAREHASVSRVAIDAGRSVYSEKPIGIDRRQATQLVEHAARIGVRIASAPDTFMGPAWQLARQLIDRGAIGVPQYATAFTVRFGPELFHPEPEGCYGEGAGPVFDIGVYAVANLVSLLGPVVSATATGSMAGSERMIGVGPRAGSRVSVPGPTHVTGALRFEAGTIATVVASFDVAHHGLPHIEVYGTEGTLSLPDPNGFDGAVHLTRTDGHELYELTQASRRDCRGIGLADMATAMREARSHRASAELAVHVVEVLDSLVRSVETEAAVAIDSRCERPAAIVAEQPLPSPQPA